MYRRLIGSVAAAAAIAVPLTVAPSASASPADHSVRIARHATDKYHSIATAMANGYLRFKDINGIACIAMPPAGGMGVHYVKGSLVGDPAIQLRHPEALVYARSNGRLRLAALEYIVLKKDWDAVHGANAPRPVLFGHRFNKTPAGNRFGLPTFYSLHAWIWKHNPAGMFQMWNPAVHCPAS